MVNENILKSRSYLPHKNPKKLIFMLHGYGDNANNFIHIAHHLHQKNWIINYIALDAPQDILGFPEGKKWLPLNSDIINSNSNLISNDIIKSINSLKNTIDVFKDNYGISIKDCFLFGFSQGGMIAFEFGNFIKQSLGGLAILSGKIITDEPITNKAFLDTPVFISHGNQDEVISHEIYYKSCMYLKNNKILLENHLLEGNSHTISPQTIKLLQKFIEKTFRLIKS